MGILQAIIDTYPEDTFMIMDGLDEGVIGVSHVDNKLIYSQKKILEILVGEGLEMEDAIEHFEYNIAGAYVEGQPHICMDADWEDL